MLRSELKKTIKVISVSLMFMLPVSAKADIKSGLDAMWNITSASTDTVNGNYGGTLGGISARYPTKSFSLIAYDAPRLQAGCGGIDIYFGSFSMISGENITQLMRAVVANATGYAFKLALDAVCPKCQSILSGLQDALNKISSASTNSCELATSFVDALNPKNTESNLASVGSTYRERLESAAKGARSDFVKAFDATTKEGKNANRDTNAAKNSTDYGNSMMNTMVSTGYIDSNENVAKIPFEVFGGGRQYIGVLMSLYGTSVKLTGSNAASSGGTNPQSKDDKNFEPLWTYREFYEGTPQGGTLVQYDCTDFNAGAADSCQNVSQQPSKWKGVKRYVMRMLAGDKAVEGDAENITSFSDDSILGVIKDNSKINKLSPERRQFLNSISKQHIGILNQAAQPGCGTLLSTGNSMADLIARQTAAQMILTFNSGVKAAFNTGQVKGPNGNKKVAPLTQSQLHALEKLEAEARDNLDQKKVLTEIDAINKTVCPTGAAISRIGS